jgi:hypothetical protein
MLVQMVVVVVAHQDHIYLAQVFDSTGWLAVALGSETLRRRASIREDWIN